MATTTTTTQKILTGVTLVSLVGVTIFATYLIVTSQDSGSSCDTQAVRDALAANGTEFARYRSMISGCKEDMTELENKISAAESGSSDTSSPGPSVMSGGWSVNAFFAGLLAFLLLVGIFVWLYLKGPKRAKAAYESSKSWRLPRWLGGSGSNVNVTRVNAGTSTNANAGTSTNANAGTSTNANAGTSANAGSRQPRGVDMGTTV
jgi:hypothetical protein